MNYVDRRDAVDVDQNRGSEFVAIAQLVVQGSARPMNRSSY
jgi:hypothetical protein